jgi:hypothetical protein
VDEGDPSHACSHDPSLLEAPGGLV